MNVVTTMLLHVAQRKEEHIDTPHHGSVETLLFILPALHGKFIDTFLKERAYFIEHS